MKKVELTNDQLRKLLNVKYAGLCITCVHNKTRVECNDALITASTKNQPYIVSKCNKYKEIKGVK